MSNKNILLILGAGGHGKSVAEAASLSGKWESIVFADDAWPEKTEFYGYPVLSSVKRLVEASLDVSAAIPAVGNNLVRQQWYQLIQDIGLPVANIIHPSAIISPSAKIGGGVTIMAGCIIGVETYIDDGVIVNMGTAIDHDVEIGQFAHLSVGVKVGGGKKIDSFSFVPAGSIIAH
ncbi:acetyltransferase [Acinetobacter pittii]|uniref:PglD-related sugar-binding protein n=1 Tax=Acinetobacter pittii TaxID=48296 RepID=UPI002DB7BE66|nr:acetyltransferase [Acinetobacter pittii]MEB6625869.1 acetyltransferase [Acinetobacter pittii]